METLTNNPKPQRSTPYKYCARCNHEFSHRSAYLRHLRRIHKEGYLSNLTGENQTEVKKRKRK